MHLLPALFDGEMSFPYGYDNLVYSMLQCPE